MFTQTGNCLSLHRAYVSVSHNPCMLLRTLCLMVDDQVRGVSSGGTSAKLLEVWQRNERQDRGKLIQLNVGSSSSFVRSGCR